jgi:hypothetical protein
MWTLSSIESYTTDLNSKGCATRISMDQTYVVGPAEQVSRTQFPESYSRALHSPAEAYRSDELSRRVAVKAVAQCPPIHRRAVDVMRPPIVLKLSPHCQAV